MNQQQMMRLKKMQKQMMEAQEKLESSVFTGPAGGGVVTVEVLTISKLSELEKLSITSYFIKKLGKKIELKETIDEKLVGGLVIKYQGKIIDGSLFTKQESLKEYLKK